MKENKKIFLNSYVENNLGDDLMIKIITERYPQHNFYTVSNHGYDIKNIPNLKVYNRKKYIILNKIIKLFTFKKVSIEYLWRLNKDFCVTLGGSMFIENTRSFSEYRIPKKQKYFILGSNFGPYKSEKYFNFFHNFFSKAEDVCFRESYSYNLFSDLPNVRYTSDIVFSLDLKEKTDEKNVVISVIDCKNKLGLNFKNIYQKLIVEFIKKFSRDKYKVTLMSFCEFEGDESSIAELLNLVPAEYKKNIQTYYYDGDINEALSIISNSEIIVGSRFHANILGMIANKIVIPIAYSDKTINVFNDLGFKGNVYDIRKISESDIKDIMNCNFKYRMDISDVKLNSEKHFKKLDKYLKK